MSIIFFIMFLLFVHVHTLHNLYQIQNYIEKLSSPGMKVQKFNESLHDVLFYVDFI